MDSFNRYIKEYGVPVSVCFDKHSTYKSTGVPTIEEELKGQGPMSQFERVLCELGVAVIHAHSPQAKGRIERLFRTFQDRLIKEMRLSDIQSLEEAKQFLERYFPLYNDRFTKTERVLRNDMTLAYHQKLYQIDTRTHAKRVEVEAHFDGTLYITYQGKRLRYHEIAVISKQPKKVLPVTLKRQPLKQTKDHPWRKSYLEMRRSEPNL